MKHHNTNLPCLLILLSFWVACAQGEEIHIAQTALGSDTGASAAHAHSAAWFNTLGNWDTDAAADGKIGQGDTVHLNGVFTSVLTLQGAGIPGNPITIKYAAGAKHSTPCAPAATGYIFGDGTDIHDIVIEGGNPGSVKQGTTQVDMENTDSGTGLGSNIPGTRFIRITNGGSNITVKNMYLSNAYVRTPGSTTDFGTKTGAVISIVGQDDLLVENVRINNAETGVGLTGAGAVNERLIVRDCYITGIKNGIQVGVSGNNNINVDGQIIRNWIDDFDVWAGVPPPNHYHCDGIQTITVGSGQRQDNLTVAYNLIGPDLGVDSFNGHIFLEDYINGAKVYNNILLSKHGDRAANGRVVGGTHRTIINESFGVRSTFAFNTIIHATTDTPANTAIAATYALIWGNISVNTGAYISLYDHNSMGGAKDCFSDYGIFWGDLASGLMGISGTQVPGIYNNFALWLTNTPYDDNSLRDTANPLLTSTVPPFNAALQSGSPAIGMVPAISWINDDFFGNARATTGMTDAGAIVFSSEAGSAPDAPTSATFTATSTRGGTAGWTDNSDDESGFHVDISTSATFASNVTTASVAADAESHDFTGLLPSTTYYVRVRAWNATGNSAYTSPAASDTTNDPDAIPPPAVTQQILNLGRR